MLLWFLSCRNYAQLQTKMVKIYTCFQIKVSQKPYHLGQHMLRILYSLYWGVSPPPLSPTPPPTPSPPPPPSTTVYMYMHVY